MIQTMLKISPPDKSLSNKAASLIGMSLRDALVSRQSGATGAIPERYSKLLVHILKELLRDLSGGLFLIY